MTSLAVPLPLSLARPSPRLAHVRELRLRTFFVSGADAKSFAGTRPANSYSKSAKACCYGRGRWDSDGPGLCLEDIGQESSIEVVREPESIHPLDDKAGKDQSSKTLSPFLFLCFCKHGLSQVRK